jgi:hypothetical protein
MVFLKLRQWVFKDEKEQHIDYQEILSKECNWYAICAIYNFIFKDKSSIANAFGSFNREESIILCYSKL